MNRDILPSAAESLAQLGASPTGDQVPLNDVEGFFVHSAFRNIDQVPLDLAAGIFSFQDAPSSPVHCIGHETGLKTYGLLKYFLHSVIASFGDWP